MQDVAVIGVGMHPWGKFENKPYLQLLQEATELALADAGLDWKEIPYVVAGQSRFQGTIGRNAGNAVARWLGNRGVPIINVWNACATGAYALRVSQALVSSGYCDKVLCVAADKSPSGFFPPTDTEDPTDMDLQRFRLAGLTNPGWWALLARRRMFEVGTTETDLAMVKVKNSRHAALNPLARYRKVFTLDEVLGSAMVVEPLRLFEICATSDGAAACIVCSAKEAKKYTSKPIYLSSVSCASYSYPESEPGASLSSDCCGEDTTASLGSMARIAIANAYQEAGVGPRDLDFAEVYDLATILELLWYEHLGICGYGEAEKLLRDGDTSMGGRIPVNLSGGCSSFGEAPPAQGLCQLFEVVQQLRGQAGQRQVSNAKVGLAVNLGLMGNCSCMILKN